MNIYGRLFLYFIIFYIFYIIETKLYKLSISYTVFLLYSINILSYMVSYDFINIVIILICILYLLLLRGNIQSLYYGIVLNLNNHNINSQQPTPGYLIREINNLIIYHTPSKIKTIIDFGCGDCDTLNKIDFNYKKIGIEYSKEIYEHAIHKIKENKYKIDEIRNTNILDYNFDTSFLLYMYEPLWDSENIDVYERLFYKISKLNYEIDIIYLSGLTKKINEDFFNKYNFYVINKIKIGSIFLNRTIYYCRKLIN